jgi:hypothetical protein
MRAPWYLQILSGDTDAGEMQISHNLKEKQLVSKQGCNKNRLSFSLGFRKFFPYPFRPLALCCKYGKRRRLFGLSGDHALLSDKKHCW